MATRRAVLRVKCAGDVVQQSIRLFHIDFDWFSPTKSLRLVLLAIRHRTQDGTSHQQYAEIRLARGDCFKCLGDLPASPYFFSLIVPNYLEEAEYIYLDNSILVLSLVAMWFTARKYIENWVIWFVVNVGTVTLYGLTELWGLMVLYVAYIGMAIWGYLQWHRSRASQPVSNLESGHTPNSVSVEP